MIFRVGKNSVVKRLAKQILDENLISKRTSFALSARYAVLIEKSQRFQHSKILEKNKLLNHQNSAKCFLSTVKSEGNIDRLTFENICSQTLDSLCEYFEELIESVPHLKNGDVSYSDGVLTVHLGKNYGTYVINRQTPNLQIWLSSPTSGPKRYNFINGAWVYKHDNTTLHSLLDKEFEEILNQKVHFSEKCLFAVCLNKPEVKV